jgi:hypothetical protein
MPHPKSLSLRLCVAASAKQGRGEELKELTIWSVAHFPLALGRGG